MSEPLDNEAMAESAARESLPPSSRQPHLPGGPFHRLKSLVSILVVAGIIVALALLWTHAPGASGSDNWVGGIPLTREAQANGLDLMMQVTPGPYFLGEMLGANLILSNHSFTPYTWQGSSVAGPCGAAINLEANGETAPFYSLPFAAMASPHCAPGMTTLVPGATLTLHELVPLTSSGEVTLEPQGEVLQTSASPDGEQSNNWIPSPLQGHGPSLSITVIPGIPAARRISLQAEGTLVRISAPPAARHHLFYTYVAACIDSSGEGSGTFSFWEPIFTTTLHEAECDQQTGPNLRWSYAVSSPGYNIVGGQIRS